MREAWRGLIIALPVSAALGLRQQGRVGVGPGASKVTKAEELGVPILDEAGFLELLETGTLPSSVRTQGDS